MRASTKRTLAPRNATRNKKVKALAPRRAPRYKGTMEPHPDPRSARAILSDWAHGRRGRIAELAREHGTHASTVSRWLTGETTPSHASRVLLEQRVGIPRGLWEVPS